MKQDTKQNRHNIEQMQMVGIHKLSSHTTRGRKYIYFLHLLYNTKSQLLIRIPHIDINRGQIKK